MIVYIVVYTRVHCVAFCACQMLRDVNGPLLIWLAEQIGYHDVACIEMLRRGAQLVALSHSGPLHGKQLFLHVVRWASCHQQGTASHGLTRPLKA